MVNGSGFWHLKLVELLLGDGVQNVTGVGGGGQLLGPLEPVLQVGAVGHELMPQEPTPLQPPTGWREGERERERGAVPLHQDRPIGPQLIINIYGQLQKTPIVYKQWSSMGLLFHASVSNKLPNYNILHILPKNSWP